MREWIGKMLESKNGNPSSKRFNGTMIVVAALVLLYLEVILYTVFLFLGKEFDIHTSIILPLVTLGFGGVIAGSQMEKKDDPNQPTQ